MQVTKSLSKFCLSVLVSVGICSIPTTANAGTLASGFSTSVWTSNGTLPWGSHTDHGSEYYQTWNAEFGSGYLTLHSIYNTGGHKYESGVAYGKVQVPAKGYNYVTVDVDIYNPNAGVRGCWPAWWLDSATTWPPEIDIAEFKGNNCGWGNVLQNVDDSNGNWIKSQPSSVSAGSWHHYGLALGPGTGGWRTYQLFLDGSIRAQGSFWDAKNAPFWIIANYAMEGDSNSPGPTYNTYVQYHNYVLATH